MPGPTPTPAETPRPTGPAGEVSGTPSTAATPGPHRRGEGRTKPLSCLIVDDSTGFLQAARMLLEREGLDIAGEATTAAEGHRLARALQPDVVLADIVLGADSGFELARRLADDPLTVGTTVVLISTHSAADFAELIEASPAAGFLPKVELSARALQNLCGHGAP